MKVHDVIIIGGGQAGLSMAYFLRRKKIGFILLDDQTGPGGGWTKTWDTLKLFSPTQYSSLSGWQMPSSGSEYPTKDEFIDYLQQYEHRYHFPIQRETKVQSVFRENGIFRVATDRGDLYAKTVVSATGTANNPFIPDYPGLHEYQGVQLHSISYRNAQQMKGKRVLVVGGGNSGAQILAEVSKVSDTKWVTLIPPSFLPEEIDGRHLFEQATEKFFNKQKSESPAGVSLSDIVQVDTVKEALKRNVYKDYPPFRSFYSNGVVWNNGGKEQFDMIIWCTGFKPDLAHLYPLNIVKNHKVDTSGTTAIETDGLWLVGYGNWTGFASATIYGVGKTAKQTSSEIWEYLHGTISG